MNNRKATEEKPGEGEGAGPEEGAEDIVEGKAGAIHRANTSDEWGESANNGDEASEDDGFATVLRVEGASALEVFGFEDRGEAGEGGAAKGATKRVVNAVASNGRDKEAEKKEADVKRANARESTGGE